MSSKSFEFSILNIEAPHVYDVCLEWLLSIGSTINQQSRPNHIEATHKVDIHTTTFPGGNPMVIKDIPKKLGFNIREYDGYTILTMDISIDNKRRDVKRFDFTDIDWYKQEIMQQFNSNEIELIQ